MVVFVTVGPRSWNDLTFACALARCNVACFFSPPGVWHFLHQIYTDLYVCRCLNICFVTDCEFRLGSIQGFHPLIPRATLKGFNFTCSLSDRVLDHILSTHDALQITEKGPLCWISCRWMTCGLMQRAPADLYQPPHGLMSYFTAFMFTKTAYYRMLTSDIYKYDKHDGLKWFSWGNRVKGKRITSVYL